MSKTRAGVHAGYDSGNNVTQMGANGVKVLKIVTFGPTRK